MTEEQKLLLETITEELGGTISYCVASDRTTKCQKIIIEYGHQRKERPIN